MLNSLNRLASLPGDTSVCCTHEYTLSNLRFALAVEPSNNDLMQYAARCQRQREQNFPTLPSSIAVEKRINPFLRTDQPEVVASALGQMTDQRTDAVSVFASLREWKNRF